jgi:hypothetical protein
MFVYNITELERGDSMARRERVTEYKETVTDLRPKP